MVYHHRVYTFHGSLFFSKGSIWNGESIRDERVVGTKKKGHVAANMQSVGQQETEMNPISFYISRFVVPTEWNWVNWLVAAGLITDRYLS